MGPTSTPDDAVHGVMGGTDMGVAGVAGVHGVHGQLGLLHVPEGASEPTDHVGDDAAALRGPSPGDERDRDVRMGWRRCRRLAAKPLGPPGPEEGVVGVAGGEETDMETGAEVGE